METNNSSFSPYHSYSQNGEDMLLRAVIIGDKAQDDYKGFYIDIGAHHPSRFSNTAYFYEQGWQGINIEPTPHAITLFEVMRPTDINLNIGIGATEETRTLYCFDDSSLNTFDEAIAQNRGEQITSQTPVAIMPLSTALSKHLPADTTIDFMSIDTAGLDVALLESGDWERHRPNYLLIEDVDNTGKVDASEVYSFLHDKGYEQVYKTPRTLLFKAK